MGGGGQQQQGGGNVGMAIGRMMGPQVGVGSPIGGVDIPPADMRDPFGGPQWAKEGFDPGFNNAFNWFSGFNPPAGTPGASQGPTAVPTTFDFQGYPYAIPASGDYRQLWSTHTGPRHQT